VKVNRPRTNDAATGKGNLATTQSADKGSE
jgi:hypothetical protein